MAEVDGSTSQLLLGPDTMDFVRIWVDVPEVIDGAPWQIKDQRSD